MSKRIAPAPKKKPTIRIAVGVGLILCFTAGVLAQWSGAQPFSYLTATTPAAPTAAASPTPNPFVPKKPAKEYIYVGGKLQAIEESQPPAGGTAFDFSGNGSGDVVVWRPSDGNWYVLDLVTNTSKMKHLGQSGETIVPGDYDGDGETDIAIWRPNMGTCSSNGCGWHIKLSSITPETVSYYSDWGQAGDIPVPAHYDEDGKMDRAVWRPSDGGWYISYSSTPEQQFGWGNSGDLPVPADYDGDGKADAAVFRPSEGNWYIRKSTGGSMTVGWGATGDVLAPADYDGDGRADIASWRPSEGNWYIRQSSNGATRRETWGGSGDRAVPADYDGDGRTDIAVWREPEGNWYIKKSSDGTTLVMGWGQTGDIPVPAAYVRQ